MNKSPVRLISAVLLALASHIWSAAQENEPAAPKKPTSKAVQEGSITKEMGDAYLKKDKTCVDEVLQGLVQIDFTGTPE